ncbi:MAG TPA: hypothetical protein VK846_10390 [Candidatus Limnocylindria bacterium]|nr:hypothetical protein [Candidatus Limnocylindria bacterium]
MKQLSRSPFVNASRRPTLVMENTSVTWEYRFSDAEELAVADPDLKKTSADGWVVVSSSTRRDSGRDYLMKRPRR